MNTYTHFRFDDAKDEMICLEKLDTVKKEIEKENDGKSISQKCSR